MNQHEIYMQRCLELAIKGMGHVTPNPMVGCVLVRNGEIIAEGYHQQFGGPHAEVNAINAVGTQYPEILQQCTLYVNLEPCSHHGKTPPCANLILSHQIPRVVIGSYDPNPLVAGMGIQKLLTGGVEVITEVLKPECDFLNRRFITFHTKKRPYIVLKWAQSADGFMALNEPRQVWLSCHEAKHLTHRWRSEEQGIMVGRNTVLIDNPQLTVREWEGKNPVRITIDEKLELPLDAHIFNTDAHTIVFNQVEDAVNDNVEHVKINFDGHVEEEILDHLFKKQLLSVMMEGGPTLLNNFIAKGLWDEARIFTTPHLLKDAQKAPEINGDVIKHEMIGVDKLEVITRVE